MWKFLVILLVVTGIAVAVFSLYTLSVKGTMNKLGLVGSDFSTSVISEQLDQKVLSIKSMTQCGMVARVAGAMNFLISSDDKQGELSFRLGQDRIKCGAAIIAEGSVETGTYEVLKGIGYLQSGYNFVNERMGVDYRVCRFFPDAEVSTTISTLLAGTTGRVNELIFDEWGKVLQLREKVEPECLSIRQKTR